MHPTRALKRVLLWLAQPSSGFKLLQGINRCRHDRQTSSEILKNFIGNIAWV